MKGLVEENRFGSKHPSIVKSIRRIAKEDLDEGFRLCAEALEPIVDRWLFGRYTKKSYNGWLEFLGVNRIPPDIQELFDHVMLIHTAHSGPYLILQPYGPLDGMTIRKFSDWLSDDFNFDIFPASPHYLNRTIMIRIYPTSKRH